MKSIESILKEQENNSVLERRKHRSKHHNEMRSQSLAREASVEQPKKQSGDVSTTLIEPASQMIAATGNSKMLVFNEQKLQEAYRKIDAYKLAQRIREKNRNRQVSMLEEQPGPAE